MKGGRFCFFPCNKRGKNRKHQMMSNNASNPARCPKCGEFVTGELVGGLCPRCLMAMNMAARTELTGEAAEPIGAQKASTPKSPPTPEEVAKFFPQFEILQCLGRGGMGVVYKARQKSLNRVVALKILAPEREKDAAFARRFATEAETLARLNHPNIITVHDFGVAGGMFYLVMEFVDGVNLRRLLQDGKLSPEEALAVVPPVCDALQYAHDRGVVHRDIKPENLLLDREGRIKIADFGIAKILAHNGSAASETRTVMGTPRYMAPEQVQHPERVDHRADIFSLGAVLYEMLTGEAPAGAVVPPSKKVQIDVRLDEIVLRALEKEPELRYQQASVLKTDLETMAATGLAKTGPISTGPAMEETSRQVKAQPRAVRRSVKLALGAVAAVMLGGAVRLALELSITVPERCDALCPVPVLQQIVERLHAAHLRWATARIDLVPDTSEAIWHFVGLRRMAESGGRNAAIPIQGAFHLVPDGPGQWRGRGDGEVSAIEFQIAATGGAASSFRPDGSGFGPVVQRVIHREEADEQGFVFFDLETGRSLPAPFTLVMRSNQGLGFVEMTPGLEQWILANRMDVLIHFAGETWSSMNLRMQEDFIPEAAEWQQATSTMVTNVFARWDTLDQARPAVPAASQGRGFHDQFDRLKAFRTRSNTLGIMQWAGQSTTPRSVKVRYRLVEATNPTAVKYLTDSPRLLYFPADRSLGTLYTRDANASWNYPMSWEDWTEFAPARGKAAVPSGHHVRLDVSPEGAKDLSPLASLAPNDLKAVRFETGRADDHGLKHIGRLTGLTALHATVNQLTDEGIAHCADLTNLLDLHLQGAKVTDRSLETISRFAALEHLLLDYTGVTDEGLAKLGRISSLKEISVMQTAITGSGLAHLGMLTNLVALYLCGTGTDDQALEDSPVLPMLERLSLKATRVTDAGLPALRRFPALRHLDLEKTAVTDAGVTQLAGLKSLEELLLPNNLTDEGIKLLDGLPSLKTLALTRTRATGDSLQFLRRLPSLKTLMLPPAVRDEHLAHLKNFPELEELWIQGSPITDKGMAHLANLARLRRLCIKNVQATDAGYAVLYELKSLEWLVLRDQGRTNQFRTGIGDDGLAHVSRLPALKHLDVGRSRITDKGLAELKRLSNLEVLDLSGTRVHGDGLAELRDLLNLRQLRLKDNEISPAGADALSRLTSLELIHLQGSRIAQADLLRLQAAIPSARLKFLETETAQSVQPSGAAIHGDPSAAQLLP
ncbi:MAG: protein kinase [Euryarchaeota archaeon]|nr:protein kinase [Euryarchaeota archaeon]